MREVDALFHRITHDEVYNTVKTTLDHLPPQKQHELNLLVTEISQAKDVQMIILFGSYAPGKWVEDTYIEKGTIYEYQSDYDLLIVTKHEDYEEQFRIEDGIHDQLVKPGRVKTPISAIFHDIKHLNQALTYGNYFFSDIMKEGILLYDTGRYRLANPKKLTLAEHKQKAQEYFDQWYASANDFFKHYQYAMKDEDYQIAAFLLHQATERYYTAMLLVFTDYRPKGHDIKKFGFKAGTLDMRFVQVFPKDTEEEKHRFKLLRSAYIDARYKMDTYVITREELEYLCQRVEVLRSVSAERLGTCEITSRISRRHALVQRNSRWTGNSAHCTIRCIVRMCSGKPGCE